MKDKLKYISNNMKSLRNRMGYTQDDMSKLLDISRKTYCDYEVNPQKVKVQVFQQISDILKCKLSDFFVEYIVTNSNKKKKYKNKRSEKNDRYRNIRR